MLNVYGIKNCNTVKKALDWLTDNDIAFTFHDFKKSPATVADLEKWEKSVSWEALLNKKGTTWKKLTPEEQASAINANAANKLLLQNNSMIKRPVIVTANEVLLGFNEELYAEKLLK